MRRPAFAAALALLAALVTASLLPAAVAAKPCPKGTTAVGAPSKPTACVGATPDTAAAGLAQAVAAARKQTKGKTKARGKRSSKAEALLREAIAFAEARRAAGEPIFTTQPAASRESTARPAARHAARAARARGNAAVTNAPASFGNQITTSVSSTGRVSSEFRNGEITLQMQADKDDMSLDIRDRSGAGGFVEFMSSPNLTPRCPTGAGDVPSKFDLRMTIGTATAEHGKRYVVSVTLDLKGPWTGHVGVSGKAETFDVALHAALEVRASVEIAATGKVVARDGTRTYRTTLDRKGLPIGTPGQSIVGGLKLFGPKGKISASIDRALSAQLASAVAAQVDLVSGDLRHGDTRWYDNRRCARTFIDENVPAEVARGDTGRWKVRVISDADGQLVADAIWTLSSACGQVTGETTRGAIMSAHVTDAAGAWSPAPYAPACLTAEVTSTAGRAAVFTDTIEPKKPDGLRFTINVTYNETMGSGIAETNMTGTGSVFLRWDETDAEGSGTYQGTEWDGTVANPCGKDMSRSRGYSGKAIVGVHRNRDGTFSVAFTAVERPLHLSFLAIVPAEGGAQDSTGTQPFCGEAKRAKTTTKLVVSSVAVPADG